MSNFTFHTVENTSGERQEILQGIKKGYGFVPNLFGYMAESPIAVKAYLQLNELLAQSSLPAAQLQVALLTSSVVNKCDFCSVAHRAIGKKSGANQQSLDAINQGTEIADPQDRALSKMTKLIIEQRGWVEQSDINEFIDAGFTHQTYMELIVVVTIKTLSNYSNHVTKPEANPELLGVL